MSTQQHSAVTTRQAIVKNLYSVIPQRDANWTLVLSGCHDAAFLEALSIPNDPQEEADQPDSHRRRLVARALSGAQLRLTSAIITSYDFNAALEEILLLSWCMSRSWFTRLEIWVLSVSRRPPDSRADRGSTPSRNASPNPAHWTGLLVGDVISKICATFHTCVHSKKNYCGVVYIYIS